MARGIGSDSGEYPAETALSDALMSVVELYRARSQGGPRRRPFVACAERWKKPRNGTRGGRSARRHGLYNRLNILFEELGRYSDDLDRLNQRLLMLRLYCAQASARDAVRSTGRGGKDALPPYNGLADDWHEKLDGVTDFMVQSRYTGRFPCRRHQRLRHDHRRSRRAATMARTKDLAAAFPNLADEDAVEAFWLASTNRSTSTRRGRDVDANQSIQTIHTVIQTTMRINAETTQIATEAMLHEFGNGAMNRLDEYSSIIWLDELSIQPQHAGEIHRCRHPDL